jgi:hypothetical protein
MPLSKKPWKSLEELKQQRLSQDETYNVWCDYLAGNAWEISVPWEDPEVAPMERWALYSVYPTIHKITGGVAEGIYSTLGFHDLQQYITAKHNSTKESLNRTNLTSLSRFLTDLKPYKCSTIIKLISWMASNSKHLMSAGERAIPFMPPL